MRLYNAAFLSCLCQWNPFFLWYPLGLMFYRNHPILGTTSLVELNSRSYHTFGPSFFTCSSSLLSGEAVGLLCQNLGIPSLNMNYGGNLILAVLTTDKLLDSSLNFWNQIIFPDHLQGAGYSSLDVKPEVSFSQTEWTNAGEEKDMLDPVELVWEVAYSTLSWDP